MPAVAAVNVGRDLNGWTVAKAAIRLGRVSVDLSQPQAILIDLDGTLDHEGHALPGAVELVSRLCRRGQRYACLSNSAANPARIAHRLARMGMKVDEPHIYSAAAAVVDHVLERYGPRPRVLNVASEDIDQMLDGRAQWVSGQDEPCDAVIVGPLAAVHATDQRQRLGVALLRRGAALVATCADRVWPSPRGVEIGAGAHGAMLGYAANVAPVYCGKPEASFFIRLCQRLGAEPRQCVLIGDNLESDIAGAKRLGMRAILTLTGVARRRDLAAVAPEVAPDRVVNDLTELL